MVSRATRKPSVLCWLLAALLALVAVSLFTGTALWLGAADDVEVAVPAIVRVDDTVRPVRKVEHGQKPRHSEENPTESSKNFETTTPFPTPEPTTTRSLAPDVTTPEAIGPRVLMIEEERPEEMRGHNGPTDDQNPLFVSEEIGIQPQVYRIPSENLLSLRKRGEDFQSPQSATEDEHNESFTNTFRPIKYSEQEYESVFKRAQIAEGPEVYENPVRRFDEKVPVSPVQADVHDGEAARHPALAFLQMKLQELHNWLSSDEDMSGEHGGTRLVAEIKDVLAAVNVSIAAGDAAPLLGKLRQLYRGPNSSSPSSVLADPAVVGNTSSLVSFGLLAFDLLLLHNVQHIAWEEERLREAEMLRDPEVLALNALFMPTDKVRRMLEPQGVAGGDEQVAERTLGEELVEFASGAFRGVLNLGRAYRHSAETARSQSSGTPLDCIWTLYCRNLDKTSRLRGPYGFLAKLNSFGLRLVMGEFAVDNILETLLREFTLGWSRIDCQKLFPRCSVKEATSVVLKSVLRDANTV